MADMKHIVQTLLIALVCAMPALATADTHTTHGFERLSEDAYVYSMSYTTSPLDVERWLPVLATRGMTDRAEVQGYELVDASGEAVGYGETAGIVLSDAPINDGRYYIPPGEEERFTLVVIATGLSSASIDPATLSLEATRLKAKMRMSQGVSLDVFLEFMQELPNVKVSW